MLTTRRIALALIAATLWVPRGALNAQTADATATVGVLDFSGFMMEQTGGSAPLGKAVSSMLITELLNLDGLTVIERQDLRKVLEEQRLALSGVVDEGTAIEVGRILGAQYMIFGAAVSVAGELRLDMRAVDVETSQILEAQKLQGGNEELLDMVTRAADRFGEEIGGGRLTPLEERASHQTIPVQATIEFSRGLDLEDRGELQDAMARYCLALSLFENFRDARRAVERLEEQGVPACTETGVDR